MADFDDDNAVEMGGGGNAQPPRRRIAADFDDEDEAPAGEGEQQPQTQSRPPMKSWGDSSSASAQPQQGNAVAVESGNISSNIDDTGAGGSADAPKQGFGRRAAGGRANNAAKSVMRLACAQVTLHRPSGCVRLAHTCRFCVILTSFLSLCRDKYDTDTITDITEVSAWHSDASNAAAGLSPFLRVLTASLTLACLPFFASVQIPDVEEEPREADLTSVVADAPNVRSNRVQALQELDQQILFQLPSAMVSHLARRTPCFSHSEESAHGEADERCTVQQRS